MNNKLLKGTMHYKVGDSVYAKVDGDWIGPYTILGFEPQDGRFTDDHVVLSRLDYYGDPLHVSQYSLRTA